MKKLTLFSATVLGTTSGLVLAITQAASAKSWNWSYSGSGINASGTFITNNNPDDLGFYLGRVINEKSPHIGRK